MGIRAVTGYVAHFLVLGYWLLVISNTAPQLRKGSRDRSLAARVALVKTAGIVLTALVFGVIHFWATEWWHVVLALVAAVAIATPLRKAYRTLVAAPRHRLTIGVRARSFEQRHGLPHIPLPRNGREPISGDDHENGDERGGSNGAGHGPGAGTGYPSGMRRISGQVRDCPGGPVHVRWPGTTP